MKNAVSQEKPGAYQLNKKATFVQKNIVEDRKFYQNVKDTSRASKVNAGQNMNAQDFSVDNVQEIRRAHDEKDEWMKYMKMQEACRRQEDSNEKNVKEQYRQHINTMHQNMIDQKQEHRQKEKIESREEQQTFRENYKAYVQVQQGDKESEVQQKQELIKQQIRDLKNRKRSQSRVAKNTRVENKQIVEKSLEFMHNTEHKYTKEQTNDILLENIRQNQESYDIKKSKEPTLQHDKKVAEKFFEHNSVNLVKELQLQKDIIRKHQEKSEATLCNVMGDSKFIPNQGGMKKVHYDVRNEKGLQRRHQLLDIAESNREKESQEFFCNQKVQLSDRKMSKQQQEEEKAQEKVEQRGRLNIIIEEVNHEKRTAWEQEQKKKKAYFEELTQQMREKETRKAASKNKMDAQEMLINKQAISQMALLIGHK